MTRLVGGADIISFAEGLISAKKQQGPFSLDLTVRQLSLVESGGSLDFGGSEYRQARAVALDPRKKSPEEPYGWWDLEEGTYLLSFNETVASDPHRLILVLPDSRLLAAGAWHASAAFDALDRDSCVLLHVGTGQVAIKQNARVSRALILEEVSP